MAPSARRCAGPAAPGSSGKGISADLPPCPSCHQPELRPDVVWFGEIPYELDRIFSALESAEFVSIGTSGAVYPAAGFVQAAAAYGARTLELNLVPSDGSHFSTRLGTARRASIVPELGRRAVG